MKSLVDALSKQSGSKSALPAGTRKPMTELGPGPGGLGRYTTGRADISTDCPTKLAKWLTDQHLRVMPNHDSRSHTTADLLRYFYSVLSVPLSDRPTEADQFTEHITPNYVNWRSGRFADRFQAHHFEEPTTTVTSYISKDKACIIHPCPLQCQSLAGR
jgi:DNA (cytosine-5)-methyltransferase 1